MYIIRLLNFDFCLIRRYLWNTKSTKMKKIVLLVIILCYTFLSYARNEDSLKLIKERIASFTDSVHKAMKWEHGAISISGGEVKLTIPEGFKFLNAEQSQYVLEDLWGNLDDNSVLGMVFPENVNPLGDSVWAYVVTFEKMGFVKDDDADDINYDDLLKELKEDTKKNNEERVRQGMGRFDLIGWAQKPYYDKTNKVLHWAKEYQAEGADEHTLNYDIRILGRKGVLSLNAVAGMSHLQDVKTNIDKVLKMAEFTEGNKYKDFDSGVDKVAAWTIGGLVAGKVLAKVGILAFFGKFLKVIIIGIVALGGGIWRFITGRKKNKEELYAPVGTGEPEQNA